MSVMKISIVIPTRNRFSILEETLLQLMREQSNKSGLFEVIIVNDGDDIPDSVLNGYSGVHLLKNKGSGAGNARNTGAEYAKGDIFLFLDDDMLAPPGCIEKHLDLHLKYPRSLISGTWEYSPNLREESLLTSFGRYKVANDYAPVQVRKENLISEGIFYTDSLATFNLSITRNDFRELGGFHTSFPYAGCEDQEFTMRAAKNGFRLIIDNSIVCLHNEKDRLSLNGWLSRQFTGVQGFVLLCELFPFRKETALYKENTPLQRHDPNGLKLKKAIKYLLSFSLFLMILKSLTRFLEIIRVSDNIIFRFYNILCGLYIFKGFRHAYYKEYSMRLAAPAAPQIKISG